MSDQVCLNCGKNLMGVKCKLTCKCGYYESCSDLYPHPPIKKTNGTDPEED